MGLNGTNVLLLANTGTPSVPVYVAVGSQRNVSFEETTEEIDFSNKEQRAFQGAPGRYKATLSGDGLFVPNDAAYAALKAAMRDGTTILVVREESDVDIEYADAIVTSLSEEFPDQAESTCSYALTVNGEWTAFPS